MKFNYGSIWKMSYPLLFSLLIQQLIGITDVIYLGRVSEVALAGSALGSTYFFTVFIIAFGFSIGAQIIMARRNGEKRYSRIGEVLYQGCSFLFVLAFVCIFLSKWLTPRFLQLIISNPEVYEAAYQYIDWRMWGLVCASLIIMMRSFLVAITTTYILTFISLVMVLANIILNYIFIFGKFGFPAMGIAGAAFASNLSEIITVVACVVYFALKIDLQKYGLLKFVYAKWSLLKSILQVSFWTMVQQFVSVFSWFLFFVAIEHLGEKELAVSNILRSVSSFPYVIINSFGAVASSLTANLIGQRRSKAVMPVCYRIMNLCALLVMPVMIAMALFTYPILRVYTDNNELIALSVAPYWVMLVSFIVSAPAWILFCTASGTGNTRVAFFMELVSLMFYSMHIVLIILIFKLSLAWCWTADAVYNIVILVISALYLYSGKWRGKKV